MVGERIRFVTCANDPTALRGDLLASECFVSGRCQVAVHLGVESAAEAFNREIERSPRSEWLVWVHQDVRLPPGWEQRFVEALDRAVESFPRLAVAGVYGVAGAGAEAERVGHVVDRGSELLEAAEMPREVDSLDELLFAVRSDSGLRLDPALGFDFYATDLVLEAQRRGYQCAVVDAPCEHHSTTPRRNIGEGLMNRLIKAGERFEAKWAERLPIATPCFSIVEAGDVERTARALAAKEGGDAPPAEVGTAERGAVGTPEVGGAGIDLLAFDDGTLEGSEEYTRGLFEMRRRLGAPRWWYGAIGGTSPSPARFLRYASAPALLVMLDSALIVSDGIVEELERGLAGAACVLPSDQRGFAAGVRLDYASRRGFDRFVVRLRAQPAEVPYDGREPWLYLVDCEALAALVAERPEVGWREVPGLLGERTRIRQHAYVHSYAGYYRGDRREMLRLLPAGIGHLLDVGGGEGAFARAFVDRFGGRATLVEMSERAVRAAREKGIEVINRPFGEVVVEERYDCVSFLDVLEHFAEPAAALTKAHSLLKPEGLLLLSVPNIGHWSVVWDLLEGYFDYQPVGILCETHVRFFTRPTLERLLEECGFEVVRWEDHRTAVPEAFTAFLAGRAGGAVAIDPESLASDSFHLLARRR